jgi:gamma-glutamylcyclotransferase
MTIQGVLENNHIASARALSIKCEDIPIIGFIVSIVKKILNYIGDVFNFNRVPASHYYFAYGSNMSLKRLEERIGKVSHCGTASLKNYYFSFNKKGSDGTGKANIVPDSSSCVEGVVYKLSTQQMNRLDHCEGVPKHYKRETVSILSSTGQPIQATTYVAQKALISLQPLRPSPDYLNHILSGARENHLSSRSLKQIQNAAQYP